MKINLLIINKIIAITLLMTHTYTWSMLTNSKTYKHEQSVSLLSLPQDCRNLIIAFSIIDTKKHFRAIVNSALTIYKISYNKPLLITMGNVCKNYYDLQQRNFVMKELLEQTDFQNYQSARDEAIFLTCAGANTVHNPSLLRHAILHNDIEMLELLFNNNTNPNQIEPYTYKPTFFSITTIPVAQIFMNQKQFDRNATNKREKLNVLWECIYRERSPELIKFYINNNINVNITNREGDNLLHLLGRLKSYKYTIENYANIAQLLIEKSPNLLNNLNNKKETPLDVAMEQITKKLAHKKFINTYKLSDNTSANYLVEIKENLLKENKPFYKKYQQLITMLKKYGGKTAKELKTVKQSIEKNKTS